MPELQFEYSVPYAGSAPRGESCSPAATDPIVAEYSNSAKKCSRFAREGLPKLFGDAKRLSGIPEFGDTIFNWLFRFQVQSPEKRARRRLAGNRPPAIPSIKAEKSAKSTIWHAKRLDFWHISVHATHPKKCSWNGLLRNSLLYKGLGQSDQTPAQCGRNGLEMLVAQAARQFEWWTGTKAPREVMRAAAVERLQRMAGEA